MATSDKTKKLQLLGGGFASKKQLDDEYVRTYTLKEGETIENAPEWADEVIDPFSESEVIQGPKGDKGDTGPEGPRGPQGIQGPKGDKGDTGANGKDGVSATHSWNGTVLTVTSASGSSSVDLKGDKGDKGDTGATGSQGPKGDQGIQGVQGPKGDTGSNGKDGVSTTHSWNGTVLTVTSASGSSSADLKGPKGDKGDKGDTGATGPKGEDGSDANVTAQTIKNVLGYAPANTDDVETLSKEIADQQTAIDGKQPKGNYALKTELAAETTAREQAIADLNARLGQQNLLIAEGETMEEALAWLESNGDKTRAYLMPDDFFYMWKETTEVGGIAYTNLLPLSTDTDRTTIYNGKGYTENTRLSGSGGGTSTAGSGKEAMCTSGFIFPVKAGDILRIKGAFPVTGSNHYVVGYDSANARTGNDTILFDSASGTLVFIDEGNGYSGKYTVDDDGTIVYTINAAKLGENVNAIRVCMGMDENTIVTLNEEIKEGGGTVIVEKWASTGHSLVQSDCSAEFARLITVTDTHTAEINGLKTAVEGRSPLTEEEKLERIKEWDAPIYDANVPVFTLSAEKAAVTTAEKTVSAVYAKYDALMARHPHYITKTNLGMCSDGVTPVYRYDFREPEPHRGVTGAKEWSETKSKAIIVSGIHWEWGGIFALYNALEEIAENPNLYNLRRNTHLIVLPVCNPYAVANMSVRNANLIEIHRNFEVDFIYPGEPGYIELGERSHGGTEPLSEVETQYIDNILRDNTDAALFLTCHSNQSDTVYGTGFTWASPATYYMCNMHYRIVDKLSAVWMDKYGNELAAGIADYRTESTPEWDNRLGSAYLSTTNGTETKQATKYGIQATNIEITDAFVVHGTKANPEPALSSFTMSRGAEVYINFLLTAFGVYRYTDKEAYYK